MACPTVPALPLEIGRGGMGLIHAANDVNLRRKVAVKKLSAELAAEPFYRKSFIAEAQVTGQLEHPNIVPVYQLGNDEDGVPYFTTKLVNGVSFARWLAHPGRPPGSQERLDDGLEIFLKVCDAVAYAHDRGFLHRDIKPENIMVGNFGQVYLLDWGLACDTTAPPSEQPGPVGTPGYLAPEQARGSPSEVTERADVFGLGAVLYEMVSGKMPYGEYRDAETLLRQARMGTVVPIEDAAAGLVLPKPLCEIVRRATAPKPSDRYDTVFEFSREVLAFARGRTAPPRETPK